MSLAELGPNLRGSWHVCLNAAYRWYCCNVWHVCMCFAYHGWICLEAWLHCAGNPAASSTVLWQLFASLSCSCAVCRHPCTSVLMSRCLQVDSVDRGGTFLGSLVVPNSPEGAFALGPALLRAGLAKLHHLFDPGRVSGGRQLLDAEAEARDAKRKVRCAVMTAFPGGKTDKGAVRQNGDPTDSLLHCTMAGLRGCLQPLFWDGLAHTSPKRQLNLGSGDAATTGLWAV